MFKLRISEQVEDFKLNQNMLSFSVGKSSLLENKLDDEMNSPPFPIKPVDKKRQGDFFLLLLL